MIKQFKQDAGRWIIPSHIVSPEQITFKMVLKLLWQYLPLQAMLLFRLGAWFHRKKIPLFPGMLQRLICILYGLEIAVGADIGGGLYIPHTVGTVIAPRKIGENCSIIAAVTIGMRTEYAFPNIGDGVFIGAGARVLGGIQIGDGAVIGANAVVISDIPPGATAVGIPARVIGAKPQPAHEEINREPVAV
jgi:serine O-acetyltransferase